MDKLTQTHIGIETGVKWPEDNNNFVMEFSKHLCRPTIRVKQY